MIRKLAHLCLVTDQLDILRDFYTQKLGFTVQFTFHNEKRNNEVFGYYLNCGDTTFIEIFDRVRKHHVWGGNHPLGTVTKGNQMDHLCFEVTGLKEFREELERRGVKMGPMNSGMDKSLQAWTTDPDGNRIELMEYTHSSWQLNPQAE